MADFNHYLTEEKGMIIVPIPGDGNCLYSAIAFALRNDMSLQWQIRQEMVAHIRSNQSLYNGFLQDGENIQTEIERTARNGRWGGELQLRVASDLFGYNIAVYTPDRRITYYPDPVVYPRTIYVSFHNGNHYNLLYHTFPDDFDSDMEQEDAENDCPDEKAKTKPSPDSFAGEACDRDTSGFDHKDDHMDWDDCESECSTENECDSEPEADSHRESADDDDHAENESDSECSTENECDSEPEADCHKENATEKDDQTANESDGDSECPIENAGDSQPDFDSHKESSPEHDDEAENENDSGHIMDKKGFMFLASKVFARGRRPIYLIILTPNKFNKNTVSETIRNVPDRIPMYYTVAHNLDIKSYFQKDLRLNKVFDVWYSRIVFPLTNQNMSIKSWYTRIIIPYVLLTVIKHKWMNKTFKFLFSPGKINLVTVLLKEYWQNNKTIIEADLDLILKHANSLMCEKCSPQCQFNCNPWHINLDYFKLNKETPDRRAWIFTRTNAIKDGEHDAAIDVSPIVHALNTIYQSTETLTLEDKLLRAYAVLNEANNQQEYHSYLLLTVDGPNMTKDTKFKDVEHDKSYLKCLYAGQTVTGAYRYQHFVFGTESPMQQILSSSTKVHLLRSKKFASRSEVTFDESTVIELLKLQLQMAKDNSNDPPFILLNKFSETSHLINVDRNTQNKILDYCLNEIPIFTSDKNKASTESDNEFFKGNYYVGEPLSIPISSRLFSSDVYRSFMQ